MFTPVIRFVQVYASDSSAQKRGLAKSALLNDEVSTESGSDRVVAKTVGPVGSCDPVATALGTDLIAARTDLLIHTFDSGKFS
jgi:hypothetical protein